MRLFNSRPSLDLLTYYKGESEIHPQLAKAFNWANDNVFSIIDSEYITLAGGAMRSFFTDMPVRDYDIYMCKKKEEAVVRDKLSDVGYRKIKSDSQRSEVWKREFIDPIKKNVVVNTFNIILNTNYDSPQEVISDFDFTVCMCAITPEQITFHPDYFTDLATRTLRLHSPEDILSSAWRLQKYIKLGYTIDKNEFWKIVEHIHDLPSLPQVTTNPEVAEKTEKVLVQSVFRTS